MKWYKNKLMNIINELKWFSIMKWYKNKWMNTINELKMIFHTEI